MRRSAIPFRSTTVYAKYPESEEEERALEKLARETRAICARGIRTGLWIAAEFRINGRFVLVTNLEKSLELSEAELAMLKPLVESRFQEAS